MTGVGRRRRQYRSSFQGCVHRGCDGGEETKWYSKGSRKRKRGKRRSNRGDGDRKGTLEIESDESNRVVKSTRESEWGLVEVFAKQSQHTDTRMQKLQWHQVSYKSHIFMKWSKGKQKKVNNLVLFDQATYDKLLSEAPKYKLITSSILSDRLRVPLLLPLSPLC